MHHFSVVQLRYCKNYDIGKVGLNRLTLYLFCNQNELKSCKRPLTQVVSCCVYEKANKIMQRMHGNISYLFDLNNGFFRLVLWYPLQTILGDLKAGRLSIVKMGQPRPLFAYFYSFSTQILQKKLQVSAGFELGPPEQKAPPPPRPKIAKSISVESCQVLLAIDTMNYYFWGMEIRCLVLRLLGRSSCSSLSSSKGIAVGHQQTEVEIADGQLSLFRIFANF